MGVGGVVTTPVTGVPGAPGVPGGMQQPPNATPTPAAPPKEFNTVSLCKFGQESVQEIVSRTNEIFQALKTIQVSYQNAILVFMQTVDLTASSLNLTNTSS